MKILFASLFICLCVSSSSAQELSQKEDIIILNQIENYLTVLDSLLFKKNIVTIQASQRRRGDIKYTPNVGFDKLVESQKMAYNSRTGLSLQALYSNQMGADVIDYSDEDNIYPYRNKFQVSLNWNIMESSLIGRKISHKTFELEGLQNSYILQKQAQSISKEKLLLSATKQWDLIISAVYQQRVGLLNEIIRLKKHLYSSRRVLYSDVISVQTGLLKVKSLIPSQDTSFVAGSVQLIDLDNYLSTLTLDTLGLFDRYMSNNLDLKQYSLEQQLLDLNKQSLSYIYQTKIGIFTKMQYFKGATDSKYNGKLDIGASVTFPLSMEYKKQKRVMRHKIVMNKQAQLYAEQGIHSQYNRVVEQFSLINNKLTYEVLELKLITQNIESYWAIYRGNITSFETLLFEYDAYLVVLSSIYLTIKEREILIESLTN